DARGPRRRSLSGGAAIGPPMDPGAGSGLSCDRRHRQVQAFEVLPERPANLVPRGPGPESPRERARLFPVPEREQPLPIGRVRHVDPPAPQVPRHRAVRVAAERYAGGDELLGFRRRLRGLIEAPALDVDGRPTLAHEPLLRLLAPQRGFEPVDLPLTEPEP